MRFSDAKIGDRVGGPAWGDCWHIDNMSGAYIIVSMIGSNLAFNRDGRFTAASNAEPSLFYVTESGEYSETRPVKMKKIRVEKWLNICRNEEGGSLSHQRGCRQGRRSWTCCLHPCYL
jgi:hypothetical protein